MRVYIQAHGDIGIAIEYIPRHHKDSIRIESIVAPATWDYRTPTEIDAVDLLRRLGADAEAVRRAFQRG